MEIFLQTEVVFVYRAYIYFRCYFVLFGRKPQWFLINISLPNYKGEMPRQFKYLCMVHTFTLSLNQRMTLYHFYPSKFSINMIVLPDIIVFFALN